MLDAIFEKQAKYNERIRNSSETEDPETWTEKYTLGIASELDEILDAIQWKRHRKRSGAEVDLFNLTYELADICKYVFSICEVWDISSDSLLQAIIRKSEMLEQQWSQEFEELPTDRPILITDIDGTLGDWRASFISWAKLRGIDPEIQDPVTTLMLDTDLSIRYPNYYSLKEQFERGGGYRDILAYPDAQEKFRELKSKLNVFVIAVTARPERSYHRIWYDTWTWLFSNGFTVDQLHMSAEPRILMADTIRNSGKEVIVWEDDPGLMVRAANSGLKVFGRKHGYNEKIKHENIRLVEKYTDISVGEYFQRKGEQNNG